MPMRGYSAAVSAVFYTGRSRSRGSWKVTPHIAHAFSRHTMTIRLRDWCIPLSYHEDCKYQVKDGSIHVNRSNIAISQEPLRYGARTSLADRDTKRHRYCGRRRLAFCMLNELRKCVVDAKQESNNGAFVEKYSYSRALTRIHALERCDSATILGYV